MSTVRPSRRAWLPLLVLAVATLLAACGGDAAAIGAGQGAVVEASPSPSSAPATWADWQERQGFGGQSGTNEVRRFVRYLDEHGGSVTLFDLDEGIRVVDGLLEWLDTHRPTACWAAYHQAVRARIAAVSAGLAAARPEVEAGRGVPIALVATLVEAGRAADALAPVAGCEAAGDDRGGHAPMGRPSPEAVGGARGPRPVT